MMAAGIEEHDRVMATAQQILKSLNTSKDATRDMISILSTFDNRFSNLTPLISFEEVEKVVLRWDSSNSDSSPEEAAEYHDAVDQILQMTEELTIKSENGILNPAESDRLVRAESAIQLAMSRLEDDFRRVLIQNTIPPLDAERLYGSVRRVSHSFAFNDGETEGLESSGEEDDQASSFRHERGASLGSDCLFEEMINPDAVRELKKIADLMIRAEYDNECRQVYGSVRRDVLDESLCVLGVEKLSIEEVQKIEWKSLDEKMKKWIEAVKVVVRVLLTGEKCLCEQIFESSEPMKEDCFIDIAKGCVMQLLNFAEAVAIGRRAPEKLFRILDMYDVMVDVLPDLQVFFSDKQGELVCSEAQGVLDVIREAAIGTFAEFEKAVQGEVSRKPIQGGEIHPLTRYVMNYMKLLVDYSETLNNLLEISLDGSVHLERDEGDNSSLEGVSPIARRLLLLMKSLELNLEEKSRMYEDGAMQYIFLMNNILYVVQRVKGSELGKILGDQWVRKHRGLIRQYSTSYLRASWSKVLSCLKDEGVSGGSSNASRVALKERFKNFNANFEEIHRIQSTWKVPDDQLREELRISISEKVIPAYRAFLGRFGSQLDSGRHAGKYIKYTPEDLENYLLDLFEGTPGVLLLSRRKST